MFTYATENPAMCDIKKLRNHMLMNKTFLMELYNSNSMTSRKLLVSANDTQIKMLLQIIYCVTNGLIPLNKNSFQGLSLSRKTKFLSKNFGSKVSLKNALKGSRKEQHDVLFKLASAFPHILYR